MDRRAIVDTLTELAEVTAPPMVDVQPAELIEQLAPIVGRRQVLIRKLERMRPAAERYREDDAVRALLRRVEAADLDWQRALTSARETLRHRVGAVARMRRSAP